MSFLAPEFLIGAAAFLSPIIIYFLIRRKVREMDWAAMQYLFEIYQEKHKRNWLEILQLILRALMLACLALALARPGIGTGAGGGSEFGSADEALIILDNTYSTGLRDSATSRLGKGKEIAGKVIDGLPASCAIALLLGSEHSEAMVREFSRDHGMLSEIVKGVNPSAFSGSPADMCASATSVMRTAKSRNRSVFIISDFQTNEWANPDSRLLAALKTLSADARVTFLPVTDGRTENVAVTKLELPSDTIRTGRNAIFTGKIVNLGQQEVKQLPVDFLVDDNVRSTMAVDIPAGGTKTVEMAFAPPAAGVFKAVLKIRNDPLEADNQYYLPFKVADEVKILGIVDTVAPAAAGASAPSMPLAFLDYALNPFPGASKSENAYVTLTQALAVDLPAQSLADYEMVIVSGVAAFTKQEGKLLEDYVRGGGGVLMFLDRNARPELFNESLYRNGDGLWAWPLRPQMLEAKTDADSLAFTQELPDHPVWGALSDKSARYFDNLRMYAGFGFTAAPTKRAVTLATLSAAKAGAGADAAAAGGAGGAGADMPFIVDFTAGRGHCLVVGASADLGMGNFPLRPAFVAFVNQAVRYLRGTKNGDRSVSVGGEVNIPADFKHSQATYQVIYPSGDGSAVSVQEDKGNFSIRIPELTQAGFYAFINQTDAADKFYVASNVKTPEGHVEGVAPELLLQTYEPHGVKVAGAGKDKDSAALQTRAGWDLTVLFLLLALLCWAGENAVGYRITTQC